VGTTAIVITASSLAKEAGDPTVDTSKACSNRRSREDERSYHKSATTVDRVHANA